MTGAPEESYRILRSRIDLSRLDPLSRAVTEHVIAASADFDYATDLVCTEPVLAAANDAKPVRARGAVRSLPDRHGGCPRRRHGP